MAPANGTTTNGQGSYAISSDSKIVHHMVSTIADQSCRSTVTANVREFEADNCKALEVKGSEDLTYGFRFTRDVFGHHQTMLADMYKKWGRVLAVMDGPVSRVKSRSDP